ncbi:MAG: dolichyl-phosphate beta-D-mannosyltransferase [Bacteroidetes bacterium SW_11_45_7]|nr:MAG: dolichyl-phosphate beta-D-mannosyltransferase [Bacteroidetes bacterium SW_11_45_7]
MSDSLVIIPTYNERENIDRIIHKVFSLSHELHILIIDDGSPDGTQEIVKSLRQEYPRQLFIEKRKGKQGLGTAYIYGFRWALQRDYQYIFEMDADFSHNPDDLLRLYECCHEEGADVAVGSRYVKDGSVSNWPLSRIFISYGASIYVRLVTFMPVRDATAGFVCYKREVLEAIDLDQIQFVGYAFQVEMKFAAWKAGFSIQEVPITFSDRERGFSKMSRGIVKEAVWGVLKIRLGALKGRYDI